jgi:hypothetical protein
MSQIHRGGPVFVTRNQSEIRGLFDCDISIDKQNKHAFAALARVANRRPRAGTNLLVVIAGRRDLQVARADNVMVPGQARFLAFDLHRLLTKCPGLRGIRRIDKDGNAQRQTDLVKLSIRANSVSMVSRPDMREHLQCFTYIDELLVIHTFLDRTNHR